MDYIKAFLVGGVICALVQILMDKTKLMPGRIMVMLVVSGNGAGVYRSISAVFGLGRSGSRSSSFGIWQYPVERSKRRY